MSEGLEKVDLYFCADELESIQAAARYEEMSVADWLSATLTEAAQLAGARAAIEEYDEEFGEPDPETMAKAREDLDAAGVGLPESPADARARKRALDRLRGGAR